MRAGPVVALLCCLLALCGHAHAAPGAAKSDLRRQGLTIRVEGDGWGDARLSQIETVLYAVADELIVRLPKKLSAPILVSHTERNPITLYKRGDNGEYLVQLHASGQRWYLYAYEFAHELCHIVSNYEDHAATADGRRENQWFEESLCEAASLYTLKSIGTRWQAAAPAPELAKQTWRLFGYFDLLFNQNHRRLPPDTSLTAWLASHETQLRDDPYQREKNQLLANQLLPLFAANSGNWEAIGYLNREQAGTPVDFQQYLQQWYRHAPGRHKKLVADVMVLLTGAGAAPKANALPSVAAGENGH